MLVRILLGMAFLPLLGCSGFSAGSGTPLTISGVIQLGLVKNADVKAFCLDADGERQANPSGTAKSDNNGAFSVALSNHTDCSILLVASGGQYEEESTGATVTLTSSDEIRSILTSSEVSGESAEVSITPLSEMVVARFESLNTSSQALGALTEAQLGQIVDRAKEEIRQNVGLPSGIDITRVIPSPPNQPDSDTNSAKNQIAVVIAGLSQLAAAEGVNSYQLSANLASDVADGSIAADYWLDLPDKIDEWAAGARNPGGFSAPPILNTITTPTVDPILYPMPNSDQLRTVPFKVILSAIDAEASANCAGPFDINLVNLDNEAVAASAGLQLLPKAFNGSQQLSVFAGEGACLANTGAITIPVAGLTQFYVRFGASRPSLLNLMVVPHPSSVLPGALSFVVPSLPPAVPAEIHMIAIYEAGDSSTPWGTDANGNPVSPTHWDMPATVNIQPGSDPIILVLSGYEGVIWNLTGAVSRVQKVITHGYYTATVNGVSASLVESYSYEAGTGAFYGLVADNWIVNPEEIEYQNVAVRTQELTGNVVHSMQGAYQTDSFEVDDGLNAPPTFVASSTNPPWVYALGMGGNYNVTVYDGAGASSIVLLVYASTKNHSGISVNVSVEHITTSIADIPPYNQNVTIPAGSDRAVVMIPFNKDSVNEGGSETFKVKFSLVSGTAQVVMPEMPGTIVD